ncbi:NapC/NirT family cytochrome c [Aliivibrio fischeri]|uniref:NapC/NirT family cytochrome c n=1 Tax=Aliivibrio fischeri TaxID=668 RepID=UPI0039B75AD5
MIIVTICIKFTFFAFVKKGKDGVTHEKYEEHRLAMAETVWEQMRENDSATCRSCHSFDAMETYDQSHKKCMLMDKKTTKPVLTVTKVLLTLHLKLS